MSILLFSFNSKEEDIQNTFSKVKAEYLNKAEPEIHIISHLSLLFNYGFLKNIFYCFDNVSIMFRESLFIKCLKTKFHQCSRSQEFIDAHSISLSNISISK